MTLRESIKSYNIKQHITLLYTIDEIITYDTGTIPTPNETP